MENAIPESAEIPQHKPQQGTLTHFEQGSLWDVECMVLLYKQFTWDIRARSNSSVAFMFGKQNRDAAQEGGGTGEDRKE